MRPLRSVDSVEVELDAGEMSARTARLFHPMRRWRSAAAARVVRALRRCDVVQQSATIESFDGGRGKAAHAERKPLQGRARVLGLLQHDHREPREAQFAGEKQADRSGAGDYDIMEQDKFLWVTAPRRILEFARVIRCPRFRSESHPCGNYAYDNKPCSRDS
jgi:hypothetical protein